MSRAEDLSPLLRRLTATFRSIWRESSTQDAVVTVFHSYMLLRVLASPDSPAAGPARWSASALLIITLATILWVRGGVLRGTRVTALIYRVGIFSPVVLSYLTLRYLLPALHLKLVDANLLALDRLLLGESPVVWLQRFNTPSVIEWFSFFYYSYIGILALALLPFLFFDRGRRMGELFVGAMLVACLGHVGYTLVPAYGPHQAMHFQAPLAGTFWWSLVKNVVGSSGAQMDVFPSLHTAFPSYFTLHAIGHRRFGPYRYTWPVLLFFALNIIVSTMLLRWHYAVDVMAGLALAGTARILAIWISGREWRRGLDDSRQPVWPPLQKIREAQKE